MKNQDEAAKTSTVSGLPLWSVQLLRNSRLLLRTRKDLELRLIARSFKDEFFKQHLLADPKAVVEAELRVMLPETSRLRVLEETEHTLYIVLPHNPYDGLSRAELERILGVTYNDVARWLLETQRSTLPEQIDGVSLITQTWLDRDFKQSLLANPEATIREKLGIELPKQVTVRVLAETVNDIYIILPCAPDKFGSLDIDSRWLSEMNMPVVVGASAVPTGGLSCAPMCPV